MEDLLASPLSSAPGEAESVRQSQGIDPGTAVEVLAADSGKWLPAVIIMRWQEVDIPSGGFTADHVRLPTVERTPSDEATVSGEAKTKENEIPGDGQDPKAQDEPHGSGYRGPNDV